MKKDRINRQEYELRGGRSHSVIVETCKRWSRTVEFGDIEWVRNGTEEIEQIKLFQGFLLVMIRLYHWSSLGGKGRLGSGAGFRVQPCKVVPRRYFICEHRLEGHMMLMGNNRFLI